MYEFEIFRKPKEQYVIYLLNNKVKIVISQLNIKNTISRICIKRKKNVLSFSFFPQSNRKEKKETIFSHSVCAFASVINQNTLLNSMWCYYPT